MPEFLWALPSDGSQSLFSELKRHSEQVLLPVYLCSQAAILVAEIGELGPTPDPYIRRMLEVPAVSFNID